MTNIVMYCLEPSTDSQLEMLKYVVVGSVGAIGLVALVDVAGWVGLVGLVVQELIIQKKRSKYMYMCGNVAQSIRNSHAFRVHKNCKGGTSTWLIDCTGDRQASGNTVAPLREHPGYQ